MLNFLCLLFSLKELELYKEELMSKPALLAVNKMDLPDAEDKLSELKEQLQNPEGEFYSLQKQLNADGFVFTLASKLHWHVVFSQSWLFVPTASKNPKHFLALTKFRFKVQGKLMRYWMGNTFKHSRCSQRRMYWHLVVKLEVTTQWKPLHFTSVSQFRGCSLPRPWSYRPRPSQSNCIKRYVWPRTTPLL